MDGTTTADDRYMIVSGRRHRAPDPAVPDPLRRELAAELQTARRLAGSDPEAAGPRVEDAEVAIGAAGPPGARPALVRRGGRRPAGGR